MARSGGLDHLIRTTAMTNAIETTGLVKHFGATRALDGVDLRIRRGSVYGLLGPNGAGKTTTVRILATLLEPTAGGATVLGHDVVREAHAVRSKVSLTGQFASVDEDLSGHENLVLVGRLLGLSRRDATRSGAPTPPGGRCRPTPEASDAASTSPRASSRSRRSSSSTSPPPASTRAAAPRSGSSCGASRPRAPR